MASGTFPVVFLIFPNTVSEWCLISSLTCNEDENLFMGVLAICFLFHEMSYLCFLLFFFFRQFVGILHVL